MAQNNNSVSTLVATSMLSVLYSPETSTASSAVDIVAIHGLGGHASHTWTSPLSNSSWLKDFLPQQIPDARILSFGYDATAAFTRSTAEMLDHVECLLAALADSRKEKEHRPLILIGHSLGGNLVQLALLLANSKSRYQSIFEAICGIIFFGTPNRSSKNTTHNNPLVNIAKTMISKPDSRMISALKICGDTLLGSVADFCFLAAEIELLSLYEMLPMYPGQHLVVERDVAILGTINELMYPVDADHSTMCKFDEMDDPVYQRICSTIGTMRRNWQQHQIANSSIPNKHFEVPQLLSLMFTGRQEELQRLGELLTPEKRVHQSFQRRYVIYGTGGSGKTQICLRYSQTHRDRYWGVFWVDASTRESIQQSIGQIARKLKIPQDIDTVKRQLAETTQTWLLIFDNADDPELSLNTYFPAGNRGDIIIASRCADCMIYSTVGTELIAELNLEDAVTLLLKTVSGSATASYMLAVENAQSVVKTLGCLALAVTQAGTYIRETGCSFTTFVELYLQQREQFWLYLPRSAKTDYLYTVYSTWQIPFNAVKLAQDQKSRNAFNMLRLLCFYHYEQIPTTIFRRAWQHWHKNNAEAYSWLPWSQEVVELPDFIHEFDACVTLLASLSLVQRDSNSLLAVHPLVQARCRDEFLKDNSLLSCQRAMYLLDASVRWGDISTGHFFHRYLLTHVLACLTTYKNVRNGTGETKIVDDSDNFQNVRIHVWSGLASFLEENGPAEDAIFLMELNLQTQKSTLGYTDPDTVSLMSNLATQYSRAGRFDEALQMSERVLQLRREILGEKDTNTVSSMSDLAVEYSKAGRFSEALQMFEHVLQLRREMVGEEHPDTVRSENNLAVEYSKAGRFSEALQMFEHVLQLRREMVGEEHPDTVSSIHNLAIQYSNVGRITEALELSERVVQLYEQIFGEKHPDTIASMHNLAIQYSNAGRTTEALELSERVVQLYKKLLGEEHLDTIASMHNLAIQYSNAGRTTEALELSERVVQLYEKILGEEHPDRIASMHNLAIQYSNARRTTEALELSESVVQLYEKVFGEEHPDRIASMYNLAIQYSNAGRTTEALELSKSVVQLYEKVLGEKHPDTTLSKNHLKSLLSASQGLRKEEPDTKQRQMSQDRKKITNF